MKPDFRDALVATFERGMVTVPGAGERWAVFNAHPLPEDCLRKAELDREILTRAWVCEQPFRPLYLDLQQAGHTVSARFGPEESSFDHALIFASRSRVSNERNFRRAWHSVKPGGRIIVCGNRKAGADGLRKWLKAVFGEIETFAKHHAICFEVPRSDSAVPAPLSQPNDCGPHDGLFSASGPDTGSAILAQYMLEAASGNGAMGRVADLGSGWGYLSVELLKSGKNPASIDLYEADFDALEAARTLIGDTVCPVAFHWMDVAHEFRKKPYETVIMNPPFHHGMAGDRRADAELGRAFIRIAAQTLVRGGRLYMVANRSLPYEQTLSEGFSRVEKLAEEQGFKVFLAIR